MKKVWPKQGTPEWHAAVKKIRADVETGKKTAMDNFEKDWGTRNVRDIIPSLRATIGQSKNPGDWGRKANAHFKSLKKEELEEAKVVVIHHHRSHGRGARRIEYDEYRVPNPGEKGKGAGYFTNDKKDAEDTARSIHGKDIVIKHRSKAYNTEETEKENAESQLKKYFGWTNKDLEGLRKGRDKFVADFRKKRGDKVIKKEETISEVAPPGREDQVRELKKKFPGDKAAAFKIAWASYNKRKKNEELQEGKNYHTVFHYHEGKWMHQGDYDTSEDARDERDSIKNAGAKKTIILRVPKHESDWRKKDVHQYVTNRLDKAHKKASSRLQKEGHWEDDLRRAKESASWWREYNFRKNAANKRHEKAASEQRRVDKSSKGHNIPGDKPLKDAKTKRRQVKENLVWNGYGWVKESEYIKKPINESQHYIQKGHGYNVGNDFNRTSEDTPIELAPKEYAKPNHIIGYIKGDPKHKLGFMRKEKIRVHVMKDGLIEK